MKRIILSTITFATFALPLAARADDSDNMEVSALISNNCTISAGHLDFGSYDPVAGTAVNGSTALSVACTEGGTFNITLSQGDNPVGDSDTAPARQMSDGTDVLAYTLYQDPLREKVWGNTTGTGVDYVAADSAAHNVDLYGTITAGQDAGAGTYDDNVVALIAF